MIKIFLYFLSVFLPGYLLLTFFIKEKISLPSVAALSYGLGTALVTLELFTWIFLLKLPFSYLVFWILLIAESLILFWVSARRGRMNIIAPVNWRQWLKGIKAVEVILLILIGLQLIFSFVNCLNLPAAMFDNMSMWSFKAKALYYNEAISFDADDFYYLGGGGHRNYPWHAPLLQFWFHKNLGEYNDTLVNLAFFPYYFFAILFIYTAVRNFSQRYFSLLLAFMLSSVPIYFFHSYNLYADLTLSFFALLSFAFAREGMERKNKNFLLIGGVFAGLTFWIKDTGIIFIMAFFLCHFLYFITAPWRQQLKRSFALAAIIILSALPWIVFKLTHELSVSNVASGTGFHPEVMKNLGGILFLTSSWNIWWFIIAALVMLSWKKIVRSKERLFGLGVIIAYFAGTMIIYLFTERYKYAVDNTAIGRNILIILPITIYYLGDLSRQYFSKETNS